MDLATQAWGHYYNVHLDANYKKYATNNYIMNIFIQLLNVATSSLDKKNVIWGVGRITIMDQGWRIINWALGRKGLRETWWAQVRTPKNVCYRTCFRIHSLNDCWMTAYTTPDTVNKTMSETRNFLTFKKRQEMNKPQINKADHLRQQQMLWS